MLLPSVPSELIRSKWPDLRELFLSALNNSHLRQEEKAMKHLISALGTSMRSLEPSQSNLLNVDNAAALQELINGAYGNSHKIRKSSNTALAYLAKRHQPLKKSPLFPKIVESIKEALEESTQQALMGLVLAQSALPWFPENQLAKALEVVLNVCLDASKISLTISALRTIQLTLESPYPSFSVKFLRKVVEALLQVSRNPDDHLACVGHCSALASAMVRLVHAEASQHAGEDDGGMVFSAASGAKALQRFHKADSGDQGFKENGLSQHLVGHNWSEQAVQNSRSLLPTVVENLVGNFCSQRVSVHSATANALTSVMLACITTPIVREYLEAVETSGGAEATCLAKCVDSMKQIFSHHHQGSWPCSLPLFGVLAYHLGSAAYPSMTDIISRVVLLRSSLVDAADEARELQAKQDKTRIGKKRRREQDDDSDSDDEYGELSSDKAKTGTVSVIQNICLRILARFLRAVSVEKFLRVVPLISDEEMRNMRAAEVHATHKSLFGANKSATMKASTSGVGSESMRTSSIVGASPGVSDDRLFLLRLLRSEIKYTKDVRLSFFVTNIIEAARQCENAAVKAENAGLSGNAKAFRSRATQLWELFPSFCCSAVDVEIAFTEKLGALLTSAMANDKYPKLARIISAGLETLIRYNRKAAGKEPYKYLSNLGVGANDFDDDASLGGANSTVGGISAAKSGAAPTLMRGGGVSVFGGNGVGDGDIDSDEEDDIAAVFSGKKGAPGNVQDDAATAESVLPEKDQVLSLNVNADRHPVVTAVMGIGGRPTLPNAEQAERNLAVISKLAGTYLPILFNQFQKIAESPAVSDESTSEAIRLKKHSSQRILQCISAFLSIASEKLVADMFNRLLQILSDSLKSIASAAQKATQEAVDKGEAAANAINKLKKIIANDSQVMETSRKVSAILSLGICIVPYGNAESCANLYKTIKSVLVDGTLGSIQKRGYQLLLVLLTYCKILSHQSEYRNEILNMLRASLLKTSASAKRVRLQCLRAMIQAMGSSEHDKCREIITELLGQVILCLRESNRRTRSAAFDLYLSMARAFSETMDSETGVYSIDHDGIVDFINYTASGLGGSTIHMKASCIIALCRLLYEYREIPEVQQMLGELTNAVATVMKANVKEISKAVVCFMRVLVAVFPPALIEPSLPLIIDCLFNWCGEHKKKLRGKIRVVVERLVRRFGIDAVERLIPESDIKLLRYIRRAKARKQRKREAARNPDTISGNGASTLAGASRVGKSTVVEDFDDLMDSDEEDADLMTQATGTTMFSKSRTSATKTSKGRAAKNDQAPSSWLQSDVNESANSDPMDLLEPSAVKSVVGTDPNALAEIKRRKEKGSIQGSKNGVNVDAKGRIVIDSNYLEDAEEEEHQERRQKPQEKPADVPELQFSKEGWGLTTKNKLNMKKRRQDMAGNVKFTGKAYQSKAGTGDRRKRGQKYEPFAYVPLDPKQLSAKGNKRSVARFGAVVNSNKSTRKSAKKRQRT